MNHSKPNENEHFPSEYERLSIVEWWTFLSTVVYLKLHVYIVYSYFLRSLFICLCRMEYNACRENIQYNLGNLIQSIFKLSLA